MLSSGTSFNDLDRLLGHCGACRRKWRLTDTDLCPCLETQTVSHIVESCPLTKLNGGLSRLHSADEDAVLWLTNYGKWHAYEKKKIIIIITLLIFSSLKQCFSLRRTARLAIAEAVSVWFNAHLLKQHWKIFFCSYVICKWTLMTVMGKWLVATLGAVTYGANAH